MSEISDTLGKLFRGTVIVFLGNLIGAGASFVTRILAANALAPEGYGTIVISLSVINFALVFLLLGLPEGLARQLPRRENKKRLFTSVMLVGTAVAVVAAVVLFLFLDVFERLFAGPRLGDIMLPFIIALPFWAGFRLCLGGFRGLENANLRVVTDNFLHQGLRPILIFSGITLGVSAFEVAVLWVVPVVVASLASLYFVYHRLRSASVDGFSLATGSLSDTMWLIRFSVPIMLSGAIWTTMQQIDNIFLGLFTNTGIVGVYDAAFIIARLLLIFMGAAEFLFLPVFSRYHSDGDLESISRIYKIATKWMVFFSFPLYLLIVSFPEFFLRITFGNQYTGGSLSMIIIMSGFMFYLMTGLTSEVLGATGDTRALLTGSIFALVLGIVLNVTLIPLYGGVGAAIASALSYGFFANLYWTISLYRELQIQPFSRSYLIPLFIALILYIIVIYFLSKLSINAFYSVIIAAMFLVVTFPTVVLYGGGLQKEDKKLLDRAWGQLPFSR